MKKKEIKQLVSPRLNQKLKISLNQLQNSQRELINVQKFLKKITIGSKLNVKEDLLNDSISTHAQKQKKSKTLPAEIDAYRYHVDIQDLHKYTEPIKQNINKQQKVYRGGFSFDKAVQTNLDLSIQEIIQLLNDEQSNIDDQVLSNDEINNKYFKFSERIPNKLHLPEIKSSLRQLGTTFGKADRVQDNIPNISPGPGRYEVKDFTARVLKNTHRVSPKKKLERIMNTEELKKKCLSLLVPAKVDITINQNLDQQDYNKYILQHSFHPISYIDKYGIPIFPFAQEKSPGPGDYFIQQSCITKKLKRKKNYSDVKQEFSIINNQS